MFHEPPAIVVWVTKLDLILEGNRHAKDTCQVHAHIHVYNSEISTCICLCCTLLMDGIIDKLFTSRVDVIDTACRLLQQC